MTSLTEIVPEPEDQKLVVITRPGGFIGGNLANYFCETGFTRIRAVDKKALDQWMVGVCMPGVENLCLDCSTEEACERVCEGAVKVYSLAAGQQRSGAKSLPWSQPPCEVSG